MKTADDETEREQEGKNPSECVNGTFWRKRKWGWNVVECQFKCKTKIGCLLVWPVNVFSQRPEGCQEEHGHVHCNTTMRHIAYGCPRPDTIRLPGCCIQSISGQKELEAPAFQFFIIPQLKFFNILQPDPTFCKAEIFSSGWDLLGSFSVHKLQNQDSPSNKVCLPAKGGANASTLRGKSFADLWVINLLSTVPHCPICKTGCKRPLVLGNTLI